MTAIKTVDPGTRSLFTFEFIALCLVLLAAFCSVSVFYSFYHYLGTIGIPLAWRGFLVGLEPMAAFGLRLFALPWLHVRNAFIVLIVSLILSIIVSCAYLGVTTVEAMIALRIFHGAVFVAITASALALVVHFIPAEKSGQGFGILGVATMIPYAVIPLLSEALIPYMRSEADIYAAVSVFAVVAIFPVIAIRSRINNIIRGMDGVLLRRISLSEIRDNFRLNIVMFLLLAVFLIFLAHATFFYFIKDLTLQTGAGDTGIFFAICIATMIAVRVFGASHLDGIDKKATLQKAMVLLVPCLVLLPHASFSAAYYLLAAVYGLCLGLILPLLNALLFSASPPTLRGFNTNMTVFSQDAAFFIVPHLSGLLITFGTSYSVLFYIAAGFVILSFFTTLHHGGKDI